MESKTSPLVVVFSEGHTFNYVVTTERMRNHVRMGDSYSYEQLTECINTDSTIPL